MIGGKEGGQFWNVVASRLGDDLVPISRPARDGDFAGLLPLFKPDCRLTSDDVAEIFQSALDLIYPVSQDDQSG